MGALGEGRPICTLVDRLLSQPSAIVFGEMDPTHPRTVFSAHGVSPMVHADAERRGLRTIDATRPLVTKVHREAVNLAAGGYTVLLIGHAGPARGEGPRAEAPGATFGLSVSPFVPRPYTPLCNAEVVLQPELRRRMAMVGDELPAPRVPADWPDPLELPVRSTPPAPPVAATPRYPNSRVRPAIAGGALNRGNLPSQIPSVPQPQPEKTPIN